MYSNFPKCSFKPKSQIISLFRTIQAHRYGGQLPAAHSIGRKRDRHQKYNLPSYVESVHTCTEFLYTGPSTNEVLRN